MIFTDKESDLKRMEASGVRPTAVRMLVYNYIKNSDHPVSLIDIETGLDTVDRSTVSRSLAIFLKHDLIHSIDDGSGVGKYEVCRAEDNHHSIHDMHVHFRCRKCEQTICLKTTSIPEVELPSGFKAENINYVITGLCDRCRERDYGSEKEE